MAVANHDAALGSVLWRIGFANHGLGMMNGADAMEFLRECEDAMKECHEEREGRCENVGEALARLWSIVRNR